METSLSEYAGTNVLITGGASFIGSHLAELLVSCGAEVTVADDLSSGSLENLAGVRDSIRFLKGDLRNAEFANETACEQDIVFHLAASHGGRGYIETHPVDCANNMVLDHVVFDAAAKRGARKIVYASSACVYPTTLQASETERILLKESDANFEDQGKAFSDGEYGWAKLMGEMQLRAFHKQYGISGVAVRIFTAYGERENESHAVIALIAKAAARMDPFPIWGNGLQTRNFTYVQDTAMGLALGGACLNCFETLNVGSGRHHTILDLLNVIFEHSQWRPRTILKELDKPVGVKSRASDNGKCRSLLGWEPNCSFEKGVAKTLRWYLDVVGATRADKVDRLLMERSL